MRVASGRNKLCGKRGRERERIAERRYGGEKVGKERVGMKTGR